MAMIMKRILKVKFQLTLGDFNALFSFSGTIKLLHLIKLSVVICTSKHAKVVTMATNRLVIYISHKTGLGNH